MNTEFPNEQPLIAKSAWLGAEQKTGEGCEARIVRYQLDGTRCGMVQGRHAAWNWAFKIVFPGGYTVNMGRGLRAARSEAACGAEFVREDWPGGKMFVRGPRGGLSECEIVRKAVAP